MEEMRQYATALVSGVIASNETYRHENQTNKRCPSCGEPLLEVSGKHGKSLVCRDRECGYRESLTRVTNARCPECHKKLSTFGEGEKKIYVCSCGFKEKFASFNQKLADARNSMNKREVARFMQRQKSENFASNTLADALKGIKLD